MIYTWLIPLLLTLGYGIRFVMALAQRRSAANPTPENVADVYDTETYERWKRYSAENSRLKLLSILASWAVSMLLLCLKVYAAVAAWFPDTLFLQMLAVILTDALVETVTDFGFEYYRVMVIEEKYGFNRSSLKTFLTDQLRGLLVNLGLSLLLGWLLCLVHGALGDGMIIVFALAVFGFTLLISFLYPIFSRIGNKFTPLEEGELKDRLMALLTKHGYQVKAIEVMDASRRTTKLNAYFTGFGKLKTIVLYDNLVNAMSPEEICAVFAHELGHGLHKDVLKQQILNLGNLLIMSVLVWLTVRTPAMHEAFGFSGVNYGFAFTLLGALMGLVSPLIQMGINAYSRHAEYRADRQAVQEGVGEALILALKKLGRENFAHLAPGKAQVILEYSHPPLSQRIEAIEKAISEKN